MIPTKEHRVHAIYRWTNTINGKIYIGSSVDAFRRYKQYKSAHVKNLDNMAIHKAMRKYGFDVFVFDIIELVDDVQQLVEREQYWIDHYKSYEKHIGYNLCRTADSRLGMAASSETRERISRQRIGKVIPLAYSAAGAESRRRSVCMIDRTTLSVLQIFPSVTDAAKSLGKTSVTGIVVSCQGKAPSAHGYYWCYQSDYDKCGFSPPTAKQRHRKDDSKTGKFACVNRIRPIQRLDLSGNILDTWESAAAYCRTAGIRYIQQISGCCRGERLTAAGYKWKYVEDLVIIEQYRSAKRQELSQS